MNFANGCANVAPVAEVPCMLDRLDGGLESLACRLTELEARLIPVLVPRPTGEDAGLSFAANTQVGVRIYNQLDTVERLSRRITALNESLEV